MKKILSLISLLMLTIAATAQTLTITEGKVTYQYPASLTGDMTFDNGTMLTILGKSFTLADVSISVSSENAADESIVIKESGEGGTIELGFPSSLSLEVQVQPEDALSWIGVKSVVALQNMQTIELLLKPNASVLRSATVIVKSKDETFGLTYLINQNVDEQLVADKAAFAEYKVEQKAAADALAQNDDSEACLTLISNAKTDIDALEYDETKTLEENKAAIDAVVATLAEALTAQRAQEAAEKLAADKAAFAEYKTTQKAAADALAQEGDSEACLTLIINAKASIDALEYDEAKTLEENKAAIDAIVATLAEVLTAQRATEAVVKKLAIERNALIAIYNALDGDSWENNTNWCSDKPVGEWHGVEVSEIGYVTQLTLSGQGVSGTMPSDLSSLSSLDHLVIENTRINSFSISNELPITRFDARNNLCISFSEITPILKYARSLWELNVVNDNHDYYDNSKFITTPSYIPEELYDLKQLIFLNLYGCNLKGQLSSQLSNLQNLISLEIGNIGETYIEGSIPASIGSLKKLEYLRLFNLNLSGGIPDEIYSMINLKELSFDCCHLGGEISSSIANLINLRFLNFRECDLTGSLPSELSILLDNNLEGLLLICNQLSGRIPESISSHPKWAGLWGNVIDYNNFEIEDKDIPAPPSFSLVDVYGNVVTSETLYEGKKYLLIYDNDIAMLPFYSNAIIPCNYIMDIYNQFYEDLGIIMIDGYGYSGSEGKNAAIRKFVESNKIPWPCIYMCENGNNILGNLQYPGGAIPAVTIIDCKNKRVVWTSKIHKTEQEFIDIINELFPNELYESSDYSKDGEVVSIQHVSESNLNVILMGDGYTDKQITDGTYASIMNQAFNAMFTEEPYKSYKHLFNAYYVNVVSKNEGLSFNHTTALSTSHGDDTYVYGNDSKVIEYAKKAIGEDRLDDALIIVMMNEDAYAGTCFMYNPSSDNYGRGLSIAYFPTSSDTDTFNGLVSHEAGGHGFAKLADEYAYEYMGAISADEITNTKVAEPYGWYKNVDFTSDPAQVKWSQFLSDSRYANEGLGCFEGGLTYWSGVWRPTDASIMRYNTGGFNAPSRYAIWYRIGKLAYGESWEGSYEDFVAYDVINRTQAAEVRRKAQIRHALQKPLPQLPPPVVIGHSWRDILQKTK